MRQTASMQELSFDIMTPISSCCLSLDNPLGYLAGICDQITSKFHIPKPSNTSRNPQSPSRKLFDHVGKNLIEASSTHRSLAET